jgi:23S rRNA (uracil1939-C5)-methyltransferase
LLTPNQEINVTIASLAHGGSGVGRFDNFVVFVRYTAPGDVVRARITKTKKNYADAELIEIITPSPSRIKAPCPVFGACGGCQWQHVSYEEQLKQKQNIVEHALSRIAKEENFTVLPIKASPNHFYYRNRAQFRTEGPRAGFYRRGSHELVTFDECLIIEKPLNEELAKIKTEIKDWPETKTSKVEVYLTAAEQNRPESVVRSTNHAHGEELGFSQVNTLQNVQMQEYVTSLFGSPTEVAPDNQGSNGNLIDLYCGNGNFSFPLNEKGWRIYGVDSSRSAIHAARTCANDQTFFSAGDCSFEVKKLADRGRKFQAVLLDPPRVGADERLWSNLAKLDPEIVVYVSCNPATFARDWARMKSKTNLKLASVQPFDMFPQTFHVELVALARRP